MPKLLLKSLIKDDIISDNPGLIPYFTVTYHYRYVDLVEKIIALIKDCHGPNGFIAEGYYTIDYHCATVTHCFNLGSSSPSNYLGYNDFIKKLEKNEFPTLSIVEFIKMFFDCKPVEERE